MFRAALELLFTILIIMVARAILTSVMKGIAKASAPQGSTPRTPNRGPASQPSGLLHKDPVCGTYVAESTAFRRQAGGQSFYYCSEACREKHALVAR
jgi:YHS domain-containing protein